MLILLWLCFISSTTSLEFEELLKDLSWALKVKILKDMTTPASKLPTVPTPVVDDAIYAERRFDQNRARTVGMEALVSPKRRRMDELVAPEAPPAEKSVVPQVMMTDENSMRLKLFRLMYETVRDSDLKVKRAELIQDRYTNFSSFQVGYLMGDANDKFSIMSDIASTLERFYGEWKPIEHINAYEQISNQAIELGHLIELMHTAGKSSPQPMLRKPYK